MTIALLGWLLAGICVVAIITIWFIVSYKELSDKQKRLAAITEQIQLHRKLCLQERGGDHDAAAQNILENKLMVYREMELDYDALLARPLNRLPAYVMGFHTTGKAKE